MRRRSSYASLLLPLLLSAPAALAQTAGSGVGIGTSTPHPAAALDISSTGKGLLIPRLDSVQRAGIPSPPTGLMVFQTDGRQGFWYYGGGRWLYLPDKTRTGDNLGNHTATRDVNLGPHQLTGGGASGLRLGAADPATATVQTQPALILTRPATPSVKYANELEIGLGTYGTTRWGETRVDFRLLEGTGTRADQTVMSLLSNGRVGIGTTNPQMPLHIAAETSYLLSLESGADSHGPHVVLGKPGGGQSTIDYIGTDSRDVVRTGALELRGVNAVNISGNPDTTPELAVKASGDVGIGTSNPAQKLHVVGQVYSSTGGFRFPDNTVQTSAAAPDHLGNHTARQNLNLRRNLLTGGGPAGVALDSVGTATATVQTQPLLRLVRPTTPNQKWPNELQIGLGSYGTGINGQTRADFRLLDGATTTPDRTVLTLLGNGNVGVGTTAPQATLDVNGSLKVGPQGTAMRNLQSGIVTVGPATGQTLAYSIVFPHAFTSTPLVLMTAASEFNTDLWDAFSVTTRWVTPTQLRVNIRRVDTETGGWGQNVRLTWMAWEQ